MNRNDLKNYTANKNSASNLLDEIIEMKTNLTNITNSISDMPTGKNSEINDKMAQKVVNFESKINELRQQIADKQSKCADVLLQLDKMNGKFKMILEEHYIHNKTLIEIACEKKYSYDYVRKLHGYALNKWDSL